MHANNIIMLAHVATKFNNSHRNFKLIFCWRYNHTKNTLIPEKLDQAVNELEYTVLLLE